MTAVRLSCCLAALAAALPASAEITPDELWALWQERAWVEAAGTSRDGDSLILEGVTFRPGEGEPPILLTDRITLAPEGDGAVRVTPAGESELRVPTAEQGRAPIEGRITGDGLTLLATGDPTAVSYALDAAGLTLALDEIPGVDPEEPPTDLSLTLAELQGSVSPGEGGESFTAAVSAASLETDVATVEPAAGEEAAQDITFTSRARDISLTLDGSLAFFSDPLGAARAGADLTIVNRSGAGTSTLDSTGPEGSFRVQSESDGGEARLSLTDGRLEVESVAEAGRFSVGGSMVPLPDLSGALGGARMALAAPLAPSGNLQDMSLSLALTDLTVSDQVWDLFDPAARLPRDPASLSVALDGRVRLDEPPIPAPDTGGDADGSSEAATETDGAEETPAGAMPLSIAELSLSDLSLSLLGAALEAAGTLTFDPEVSELSPAIAPDGTIDVTLTGAGDLLTTLGELRLIPEGMVVGIRMGLASFFAPGEGDDTLTSTITFEPTGGITVNKNRLR